MIKSSIPTIKNGFPWHGIFLVKQTFFQGRPLHPWVFITPLATLGKQRRPSGAKATLGKRFADQKNPVSGKVIFSVGNSTFPNSLSVWAVKSSFPPFSRCFPLFSRVKWVVKKVPGNFEKSFCKFESVARGFVDFFEKLPGTFETTHFTQENSGK